MTRKTITDAVEAAGACLFATGVFVVSLPAGLMVSGLLLVLGAYLAGGDE
jgi:hypothetical protein